MSRKNSKRNPAKKPAAPLSRRKLWSFRLMALIGVPLLLLGLLELGLRLAGFGYPTTFLLKSSNRGEETFLQNNQFGWRFFGARAARLPEPFSVPRQKPPGTIRVFVFGESAAYGDPQPRFGLPRMLEAMLELRHPDKKFEVVNAAMTGINSHVILPLARDCEEAHADVWVIYMGNNEVVGPFGAGTVFGGQTTPLPVIRAGLALKATRSGQLFDALRQGQQAGAESAEWEGMRAFVKYKVAASDPRLAAVYRNFQKNLRDIIAAGQGSGARIVLSTVAVNLKECAPFGSLHRDDLSESSLSTWQQFFNAGVKAQTAGDLQQAAADFDQAAQLDNHFAELRFRRGQCLLALNNVGAAQKEFAAARDLDALRFRCDSRLNEIIRQQGTGDIELADGEAALAAASPSGIPGTEFFHEHVHLTFEGNYSLARTVAEKVEKTLGLSNVSAWPELAACAQRLGYTSRDTQLALSDISGRMADVPFTFQCNHDEQLQRLSQAARGLPPVNSPSALSEARTATEVALGRWPADATLWEQLSEIKEEQGDLTGAEEAIEHALATVPSNPKGWQLDGILLAQSGKLDQAEAAFKQVIALDPQAVWARHNLGLCLEKRGQRDDAIREFKHALALKPNYGTAWLSLGQLYETMGRTNEAQQCFTTALTNRINQADDLALLARFCVSRHWFELAVTNFAAAVELAPTDPQLRLESGRALVALGRHEEALRQYRAAVDLAPDQLQPHMQLGVELGRLRQPALAESQFREVLRINPSFSEAQLNLGIALLEQGKRDEARSQFEAILQLRPNDAMALHYLQQLQTGAAAAK